eukprot:313441_1
MLNPLLPFWSCVGIATGCGTFMFCFFYGDQKKISIAKHGFNNKWSSDGTLRRNKTFDAAEMSDTESLDEIDAADDNIESIKKSHVVLLACLCFIELFKAAGFSTYGAFMIMYMVTETVNDDVIMASIQLAIGQ